MKPESRYAYPFANSLEVRIGNALLLFALAFMGVILSADDRSARQANKLAHIFKPALDQVQCQTQIPILLPSKLPAGIRERDIKSASGTVSESGYDVSLYYAKEGSEATFAAGFGGSTKLFRDLPNTRLVTLGSGIVGMFRAVKMWWLLCACKLVVGTGWCEVSDSD